jgi:acetyltransferase-like isoleucine patch superfamily enzyme
MSKYKEAIWYLRGWSKTLCFNLRYFPLKQAIKLPVLVSPKTRFICLGGEVRLSGEVSFGMIRLGGGNYSVSDREHVYTVWQNRGRITFKGKARLSHGTRLCCNGDLIFGNDVLIGPECDIIAFERVELGELVSLSWRIQICDNDFHPIHDLEGNQVNQLTKPIYIGKRVWLGNHVKVGKGVTIDDYNIIGQSSVVVKSIHGNNQVFAGFPAKLIREGVRRIQD